MMQSRTILIGALALVFGIAAAAGAYMLVKSPPAAGSSTSLSVVVAAEDIGRGQTLTAKQLTQSDWPKDSVPEGAITNAKEMIDRTAAFAMIKGDVLSEAKLAPLGSGRGMAAVIPTGMRAVTIQTPTVATGVAGFILPGNKVDVLMTISSNGSEDSTGGGSTITLLQNIEILAVDQRIDAPQDNKMELKDLRSVTLLVNPADAVRLDLGQNKGVLQLALRNYADTDTTLVEPATLAGLHLGSAQPIVAEQAPADAAPAPLPKRPILIRTLRGSTSGFSALPSPDGAENPGSAVEVKTVAIPKIP